MSIHLINSDITINNMVKDKIYYPIIQMTKDNISKNVHFLRHQNHATLMYLYEQNIKNGIIPENVWQKKHIKDNLKIVLYCPPEQEACGGIMVMHNLAKSLIDINHPNIDIYLYYYDHQVYNNNFCNNFFNPFNIDDNTLVIYPETIVGNPLNAKHVVRWILLELGLDVPSNHYKHWDTKDLVYHWEPSRLEYTKQLVNIWVNPDIKRHNYGARNGKCYGIKKMKWISRTLHPKAITKYHNNDTISIDSMNTQDIIKTFNESRLFYCYDPNTFYTIMAPLCGCITVLHPVHNMNKQEYFQSRIIYHKNTDFYFDAGIAYGNNESEIQHAYKTIDQAPILFARLVDLYKNTITDFVNDALKVVSGELLNNTVGRIYKA